ncbi:hypothetical protein LTR08_003511 [Meristemomyces frigidus]|nr:hypothetical protein LTR08_003511 [Meristemomyces frigidus]
MTSILQNPWTYALGYSAIAYVRPRWLSRASAVEFEPSLSLSVPALASSVPATVKRDSNSSAIYTYMQYLNDDTAAYDAVTNCIAAYDTAVNAAAASSIATDDTATEPATPAPVHTVYVSMPETFGNGTWYETISSPTADCGISEPTTPFSGINLILGSLLLGTMLLAGLNHLKACRDKKTREAAFEARIAYVRGAYERETEVLVAELDVEIDEWRARATQAEARATQAEARLG